MGDNLTFVTAGKTQIKLMTLMMAASIRAQLVCMMALWRGFLGHLNKREPSLMLRVPPELVLL